MGSYAPSFFTDADHFASLPPTDISKWEDGICPDDTSGFQHETEEEFLLREKELYQTPAPFRISLLANSNYYEMGFTAIIKREGYFQLVVSRLGSKGIILSREFSSAARARDFIFQAFIRHATGYFAKAAPVWTKFYLPEKQWLEEKIDLRILTVSH